MRKLLGIGCIGLLLIGCASSSVGNSGVDGGPGDDAGPTAAARDSREIVSGGARVSGGTLTVDVEVGHAFGQQRMTGGTLTVEGAAAIKRKPHDDGREVGR
jgi:hypothetical protein